MEVKFLEQKISQKELAEIANQGYGVVVKLAADIDNEVMAIGGEYHSDCLEVLIEKGFSGDIWGANIYLGKPKDERVEYIALINIKPSLGNRSMEIQDNNIKEKVRKVVDRFIE